MLFFRPSYFFLFVIALVTILTLTSCSKDEDEDEEVVYIDPLPFPELTEDNTGSRTRSITYVYDGRAHDATYPPKIDSSIILFSYNTAGKVDRIRLTHNDFWVYDFTFERNSSNKLLAIHCNGWGIIPEPKIEKADLVLEYNGSGNVSLLKSSHPADPSHDVDSFIIKSTGNRIDTLIDRTFAVGTNTDKYKFTYDGSGDIIQMDHIYTQGIFFVYQDIYKYTLSGSPAAVTLGDEAIFWNFFARHLDITSNTDFMIPAILFHSAKQPSKLVLQVSGFYTGNYNYQTEYYSTGRPKKMTADVITLTGALYAREAYYYNYAQ